MADKYPSALVEGIDLSPIQPSWVAPNTKFVLDDIEDPWTYPPDHFDLVHLRVVTSHMKDVQKLFDQSYKCASLFTPQNLVAIYAFTPFEMGRR